MIFNLNLAQGLTDNDQYKAWKFMGGELHFMLKRTFEHYTINTRLNSSEDIMLLYLAAETIYKQNKHTLIDVFIPYCPYAQADRDFGENECFSLKSFAKLINACDFNVVYLFDPHSSMAPTLINNSKIIDNSEFIKWVIGDITSHYPDNISNSNLVWLSPDAGAYKKIGALATKIGWPNDVAAANKYRNTSTGNIDSLELSVTDFGGKDILIIDDLCMGGNTFIMLLQELKKRNIGKAYLAVTHMIPEKPNMKLEVFDCVYHTNSRFDDYYPSINSKIYKI